MEKLLPTLSAVSGNLKETEEKVTKKSFTSDKVTRKITVREVENGFIVEITEEGTGDDNQWYYSTQTWVSKVNPLDETAAKEMEQTITESIATALKSLKM